MLVPVKVDDSLKIPFKLCIPTAPGSTVTSPLSARAPPAENEKTATVAAVTANVLLKKCTISHTMGA